MSKELKDYSSLQAFLSWSEYAAQTGDMNGLFDFLHGRKAKPPPFDRTGRVVLAERSPLGGFRLGRTLPVQKSRVSFDLPKWTQKYNQKTRTLRATRKWEDVRGVWSIVVAPRGKGGVIRADVKSPGTAAAAMEFAGEEAWERAVAWASTAGGIFDWLIDNGLRTPAARKRKRKPR